MGVVTHYRDDSYLDAAFVKLYNGNSVKRELFNGDYYTSEMSVDETLVGVRVYKYGYKTGKTSGVITEVDCSTQLSNGKIVVGLSKASYSSSSGDSGGAIITDENYKYGVGIHVISSGYFFPIDKVFDAFNLQQY